MPSFDGITRPSLESIKQASSSTLDKAKLMVGLKQESDMESQPEVDGEIENENENETEAESESESENESSRSFLILSGVFLDTYNSTL